MTTKVDGRPVARRAIERGKPLWMSHTEGFDVGADTITAVNQDYSISTSRFTGVINRIVVTRR